MLLFGFVSHSFLIICSDPQLNHLLLPFVNEVHTQTNPPPATVSRPSLRKHRKSFSIYYIAMPTVVNLVGTLDVTV